MTVNNVLVVGGGITGTVLAIALAQKGVKVVLAERSPVWYGVGHGITLQGNALGSFDKIGAYSKMAQSGCGFDDIEMFHASGALIARMPIAKAGGPTGRTGARSDRGH